MAAKVAVDEAYEFDAPRWFDFLCSEAASDVRSAERWFQSSSSHAPSPFMPKIRERRSVEIQSLCDFESAVVPLDEGTAVAMEESPPAKQAPCEQDCSVGLTNSGELQETKETAMGKSPSLDLIPGKLQETHVTVALKELVDDTIPSKGSESSEAVKEGLQCNERCSLGTVAMENAGEGLFEFPVPSSLEDNAANDVQNTTPSVNKAPQKALTKFSNTRKDVKGGVCTPRLQMDPSKGGPGVGLNILQPPSVLKTQSKSKADQSPKSTKLKSVIKAYRDIAGKVAKVTDIAVENQAIKRQKLDDGRSRQILNVKTRVLPHKSRGVVLGKNGSDTTVTSAENSQNTDIAPFVSAAEMVKKFESRTRELEIPQNKPLSQDGASSAVTRRPQLMLTRPKEPALRTAHRVRAVRVKSSEELEAEMLANMPKFRARPFNKKILEVPSTFSLPRSTPQLPEFHEFNLKTMERANRHGDTCSEISVAESSFQGQRKLHITEPKAPQLETSMRARPPRMKSSQELEIEELEKIPKFKARPLNKKILESKGDVGLAAHSSSNLTIPKEFHFATDVRLGPALSVAEIFDKMSLHSDCSQHREKQIPRITVPNPFNLRTEERGNDKERLLAAQLLRENEQEEKSRIPKANPYPYTTDYPVVPLKPKPKPCTRPEGFQLESLVRHEEEMMKKVQESEKCERELAERRLFKAQPILKEDPIPLPKRVRKPLTQVQEFPLHVDHRSIERAEFDQKIKEKEMTYKRIREENEFAQQIEEEKALKQLRRSLVPQALPLPKFDKPFVPGRSTKSVTKPKSPQLLVKERGPRKKPSFMR